LIILHSNICKYENQQNTETLIKELEELDINIVNQIAMTTTQIEFIKLSNHYLLPIYPLAIRVKQHTNKFKLLKSIDMIPLSKYIIYKNTNNKDSKDEDKDTDANFEKKMLQNGYKISKIFYDELKGIITSLQFENNLIVPIIPEPYTYNNTKDIIAKMIKHKMLTSVDDSRIETLFRPAHFDFHLEMSPEIEILNLRNNIYKDFIYNYFKYEFSRILQEKNYKNMKQMLIKAIDKYINNKINFNNTIDNIVELIIDIMKIRIYNYQDVKKPEGKKNDQESKDISDYISLKVCSKTKKATKFCKSTTNGQLKEFYLDMNKEQLDYFSYLIANDLINKKIEANELLTGSFIPEFNMKNKIYHSTDEIIISSTNELLHNIDENMYSKYKQNILLSQFLKDEKEYIFTEEDITTLNETNINEFKAKMNTVITDLVDLSIRNIFTDEKIFTTPFNKEGKYDKLTHIDECKFPYINKHTGKYIYQCTEKPNGYMCPTKLDYTRTKADNWGYCPENLNATKKQLKIIEINAEGDDNNKEYKEGQCDFPFISKEGKDSKDSTENEYALKYECNEIKDSNNKLIYSWCPIKYNINKTKKNNKNNNDSGEKDANEKHDESQDNFNLLKASTNTEDIKIGKWYNGKFLMNKLTNKKYNKGYCQPPTKTLKIMNNKKNEVDDNKKEITLTLDNYKPGNCNTNLTPSKGGYNRDQLYDFGVDYLKIPHTQLRKDNKIDGIKLQKDVLCKIINNKYREIQKSYGIGSNNSNIIFNAYEKDIEQCENGESKGGYTWPKLKDIAITYFGLTEEEIKDKDYKKIDLCKYISKMINKQEQDLGNPARKTALKNNSDNENSETENSKDHDNSDKDYNMKYDSDIKLCNETPKRGGLSLSKVKKIAEKNFNIDIQNKNKKELCSLIEAKLQKHIKPILNRESSKNKIENNLGELDEDEDDDNEDDEEENEEEDEDEEDKEDVEDEEEKYKESKV